MSQQNGVLTPPPAPEPDAQSATPSSPSAAKRKRSSNGSDARPQRDDRPPRAPRSLKAPLEDILEILKSYDTTPSILNYPIPTTLERGEPNSKRAKLAQIASSPSTVANKASSYASLDDFVRDVDAVCAQLSTSIHPSSNVDDKLLTGILAFKKVLKNIVIRESLLAPGSNKPQEQADGTADEDNATNGVEIKLESEDEIDDNSTGARSVLTLFAAAGAAGGNKQLFTSLQKPVKVHKDTKGLDTSVDVLLPLDESNLPSMISATKVIPVHTEDAIGGKAKGPTFGEIFGPPPKFRELKPPIPSSQTTTRGNTVVWAPQDPLSRMSRRGSTYSSQRLTAGDWLGYGGVDPPKEPSSPSAKRKQRDRALSTGEVNPPKSEEEKAALERAKADALFRSVYSSFAPTRDDGTAVVPEETKNRVWWQKVGERRFYQCFAIDPALADAQPGDLRNGESTAGADEDEAFKEAVESFEAPEELNVPEKVERDSKDREVDEILKDINELLETLHSYQRIRFSTLTPSSRTPATQDSVRPSTPSSEEVDVYNMLKSQLALMVSTLPPYALAKLNGEQLEDLKISKNLVIKTKDYKGVLEEDQVSKLAKTAAIGAGTVNAAMAVRPSAPVHGYAPSPAHYGGRPPPGPQYAGRPVGAPTSYYTPQPAAVRSPSIHHYPTRTAPNYQAAGGYPATAPRSGFPPSYSQQTPVRTPSYGATASTYQSPVPMQQYPQRQPSMFGMGPPHGYQPRTQGHGPVLNYTATGSPHVRNSSSPLKQNPLAPTASGPHTPYGPRPPSAAAPHAYGTPGAHAPMPQQQPGRQSSYYGGTPGGVGSAGPYSNSQQANPYNPGSNPSYQAQMAAYTQNLTRHGQIHAQAQPQAQAQQRQTSATPPQPPQGQGQRGGGGVPPQPVAS